MASVTIDGLNNASNISVENDNLIIGQGSFGRKATIKEFFKLTATGSADSEPNIPFITYDRPTSLTEEQKAIARSNLGIDSRGTIASGVTSVNTFTGDVFLYLSSLKYSSSNSNGLDTVITDAIGNHNNSNDAHEDLFNTKLSGIENTIDSKISEHNAAPDAHSTIIINAVNDAMSTKLYEYVSKVELSESLGEYTKTVNLPSVITPLFPTKLSDFTDDLNTVRKITVDGIEIPNVSHTVNITLSAIGAVPTSRTINGKALSSNIALSASDVNAVPTSRTVNSKALSANITLTASDVSALPLSGGTLTGNLTMGSSSKIILNNTMYGTSLPSSGTNGQIFFLIS